jgi:hypothetical protein
MRAHLDYNWQSSYLDRDVLVPELYQFQHDMIFPSKEAEPMYNRDIDSEEFSAYDSKDFKILMNDA